MPLEQVADFGANPGDLAMYIYRPASLPERPAVVVALHGCKQNAQDYADHSGLPELADRRGFLLVLAETRYQAPGRNPYCFRWDMPAYNARGQGEVASIRVAGER